MKKEVNIHELTGAFNTYRQAHLNDEYLYDQLMDILNDLGFNKSISKSMTKFFEFEKIGPAKVFRFMKTPIHETQIKAVYEAHKGATLKSKAKKKRGLAVQPKPIVGELSDDEIFAEAKRRGFKMCRPVFDEVKFKEENPGLYQKYVKYVVA